jgi:predicted metalloprotease with PDZ domain
MSAKTVTGSAFTGALAYGAGLHADRPNQQAQLRSVATVGSLDPAGIAAEMREVAALGSHMQQLVWHTILSRATQEQVRRQQKRMAAARACWWPPACAISRPA